MSISPYIIPGIKDEGVVRDQFKVIKSKVSAYPIMALVCREFHIHVNDMKGKSRLREFTLPRQFAMSLMFYYSSLSFEAIGSIFKRHHTTVMYAKETVESLIETDKSIKASYLAIEKLIEKELLILKTDARKTKD